jgi:dihydropyrimidinase
LDADLAIWNSDRSVTVTADMMHDNAGYTPYEGRTLNGWPETIISRGRVIVNEGNFTAEPGSGNFLPCEKPEPARPLGRLLTEVDPVNNFGAQIIPETPWDTDAAK